ncbi:MAG: hypothetical protein FK731_08205 [Asgard group archaeon]|nr:hypothetical protein [Asgard group archaeon]
MQLLVSPTSVYEALECVKAQVDIIDVKNPFEGSLGANFPWVIREIREVVPENIPISATIGDVPFKPGTVALAALGASQAGASFVKVGLFGTRTFDEAIKVMKAVTRTVDEYQLSVSVVAAGYAEGKAINSVAPSYLPVIASETSCDYVMIDTFDKSKGKSIFDLLSFNVLENFIQQAKDLELGTALGGSIQLEHLPIIKRLQPDIIGIRSAVCEKGDRLHGTIRSELVTIFKNMLKD